jgi:hypothetical protein
VRTPSPKPRKDGKAGQSKPLAGAGAADRHDEWQPSQSRLRAFKSIIEAIDDPDLFGGMFDAPSWEPWKVFLRAMQALPMTAEQLDRYRLLISVEN